MAIEVTHSRSHSRAVGAALAEFGPVDRDLLAHPDAQAVVDRLFAAVGNGHAVDATEHVLRVACDVIRARRQPRNPYARPTL